MLRRLVRGIRRRLEDRRGRRRLMALAADAPLRLVLGSSGIHDEGWIPTDVGYLDLLNGAHWERFFRRGSIDAMLAEHVWEHLSADEGLAAARRCHEYLRNGGYLRVAVPDGYFPDGEYIEHVRPGGSGSGAHDHKVLYTYASLSDLFLEAGFEVKLLEYHDAQGRFHRVDWDPALGKIHRSSRFDERNRDGVLRYTSIVLDAHKSAQAKLSSSALSSEAR
jgi:predicted SAM-dependent methyltransferase